MIDRADDQREAVLFAMHLLVPRELLLAELGEHPEIDLCDDTKLEQLAKRFGVSMTVLLLRMVREYPALLKYT